MSVLSTLADADPEAFARYLASLPSERRAAVRETVARAAAEAEMGADAVAEWRSTPATMASYLTATEPERMRLWRYTRLLGEKYRQAATGESIRQIWNLPARMGKSRYASQWGPAWQFDRNPASKLILVSYGDLLALENAIAVRTILRQYRDQLRATLSPDRQQGGRFTTTQGGGLLAAGILSTITGFGGDAIFDDPFKNWQEAHSAARRDLIDNQFKSVVATRLENEHSFCLVVQTRWHEDDTSGRLQKRMEDGTGEQWDVTRIPALAEAYDPDSPDPLLRTADPLGRHEGEVIEPERFSLAAVKARHLSMGSYLTSALEQQRPAPEEGGEIKRAWFRLDDNVPASADEWITSWDMKLKDKEAGDFVVGQTWARTGSSFWLTAQLRGQWNQPTTENAIALAAVRQPHCRLHVLENTGNGPEVADNLRRADRDYEVSAEIADLLGMNDEERQAVQRLRRRGMSGIHMEKVQGDKSARMRVHSGKLEAGDVHVWASAPWLGPYLDEMAAFPNGAHDDQCFPSGTPITTPTGPVPIEAVRQGDVVLGQSGWVTVERAWRTGVRPVIRRFGISATAEHPVWTDRGWIPLAKVRGQDMLRMCEWSPSSSTASPSAGTRSRRTSPTAATSIRAASGLRRASRPYTARSGRPTTGLFPLGTSSTTETAIWRITASRIWRALLRKNTERNTLLPALRSGEAIGSWHTWTPSGNEPASGIGATRVGHGTAPTRRRRAPTRPRRIARTAIPTTRLILAGTRVRANAGLATETGSGSDIGSDVPVYNLRTTDHTYYADGVLVHNCDSTSQALKYLSGAGTAESVRPGDLLPPTPISTRGPAQQMPQRLGQAGILGQIPRVTRTR